MVNLASFLVYALCAVTGLAVVVLAPYAGKGPGTYTSFLPWIRAGVEGASWATLGGLALAGALAGYLTGRRPVFLGTAMVALLPLWATIEMVQDPTSHNLWPLEFGIYAFWAFIASLGARAGIFLNRPAQSR